MANKMVMFISLALAAPAAGAVVQSKSAFLAADQGGMRPEVVARTLSKVEDEWRSQAAVFVKCNSSAVASNVGCDGAPASFTKSCATVVSAIVQGSNGNRDNAKDYLNRVCGQKVLVGWQKLRCTEFALAIVNHGMNADDYANREHLMPANICTGFWSTFVTAEQKREAEEAVERAQEEQKKAKEAAEAKKKADEKAKEEAKKLAEEQAKRDKEEQERKAAEAKAQATKAAAEAKAKAAEAAERLAQKKAEAVKIQQAAEEKAKEAAEAEKEHDEAMAKHKRAQELLHNTIGQAVAKTPEVPKVEKAAAAKPPAAAKEVVSKPVLPKPHEVESLKASNATNSTKLAAPEPQKEKKVADVPQNKTK
jgi:hypothetical protein